MCSSDLDTAGNIIYKGVVTGFTLQTITPTVLTGVNENSNQLNIVLQPNPAHEELILKGLSEDEYSYSIINSLGQEMLKGQVHAGQLKLHIESLQDGIYYLQLSNNQSGVSIKKFVKN